MLGSLLRKRKVIGLDVGSGSVKALALEGRGNDLVITLRHPVPEMGAPPQPKPPALTP